MIEQMNKYHDELAKLIERHTPVHGVHVTAIPSLLFMRYSNVTGPRYGMYKPSICMVVQGAKEVWLAQERFKYSPTDYLIASVDLPVTAQVTEASSRVPYLGFKLEFTPSQILAVLRDSQIPIEPRENAKRAMFVSHTESSLLDAVIRLARLLDSPEDIPVLAPLFVKEILYRVLHGQHGVALEQTAIEGSSAYRIKDVIEHITKNFERSFRIDELAKIANMGISSLHRHFKEVTAMSPIQFQKQLRLQEARRLLLSESTDATDIAFRVGYESPSQFSREYSRMYGLPPIEDVRRLRAQFDQSIEA
ncbi:AraC family transcriptional regulator [Ferroacidibacillus organovorans]|uniref:AraC family transcriptional regulator n=1 Tax=Ferroacidibacillus organovorans TaxID=1765683 RepID=A0A101XTB2_9BACL|nr:AraC family transcriptional regulator [Ferroacidibacillus organovorans]KUO97061.1 AraC family transcriptional regulator [Ferroacidibacillus organovorans]